MRISLPCAALLAVALAACQPIRPDAPAPVATTAPAAASVPADDNLNAVLWVQRSAEYQAAAIQTYRAAADHLDAHHRQRQNQDQHQAPAVTPGGGACSVVVPGTHQRTTGLLVCSRPAPGTNRPTRAA